MSWLGEIESALSKKQQELEVAKEARNMELGKAYKKRKRDWEIDEKKLGGIIKRWGEWRCNEVLKDIRDLLWAECRIDEETVFISPIEGEQICIQPNYEAVKVKKGIFSSKDEMIRDGWVASYAYERRKSKYQRRMKEKSGELSELLARLGIGPEDVTDLCISNEIYCVHERDAGYGETSYEHETIFKISLYADHVEIGIPGQRYTFDETKNATELREKIIQNLRERPGLRDRLST